MIGDASVSRRRQLVQMNVGKVMIMIFCFLSLFIVDGAKKVRVKVQVSESVKFMIPIIPTATVGELLEICIARGEKLHCSGGFVCVIALIRKKKIRKIIWGKKIVNLTNNPGVYKMLSDKNEILYVGKAKNIPNRLKIGYIL